MDRCYWKNARFCTELDINPDFSKISIGQTLILFSDSVIKDLSSDQAYGDRITDAIRTGNLPSNLTFLEMGLVSHSR